MDCLGYGDSPENWRTSPENQYWLEEVFLIENSPFLGDMLANIGSQTIN